MSGPAIPVHALFEGGPAPLYHRVHLVLRDRIVSGIYEPNGLIPSELELATEFEVSRITVRRAVNDLATAGLVERRRGSGTRVVAGPRLKPFLPQMEGSLEDIVAIGLATGVRVLEFDYVVAPELVRDALALPHGAAVQRSVRVRDLSGLPFSYTVSFIPEVLGRSFDRDTLSREPILSLLERAGVRVATARQTITAAPADLKSGEALGLEIGAPLLKIERIVLDQAKVPIQFITVLYRPDRYQASMSLQRQQGSAGGVWLARNGSPSSAPASGRRDGAQARRRPGRNREATG